MTRWLERAEVDSLPDEPMAALERRVAELLGKEKALFFPSGTMAQQVALRIHGERRGRKAFAAHPQTHLDTWEQRGYTAIHGLRFQPVGDRNEIGTSLAGEDDGTHLLLQRLLDTEPELAQTWS